MISDIELKPLFESNIGPPEQRAYIFVFPGIGTPAPEEWYCDHHTPWLQSAVNRLVERGQGCTVVAVYHHLLPEDLHSWHDVLKRGVEALVLVEEYRERNRLLENPILFVCHSLGGVMAKQLLIHAKRSDDEHDSLFRALQGLIFLSTPHVPEEHSEEWRKPLGILLIELKQVDSQLSQEKQLQTLARASAYFEDMTLPLPIMSTWETKPTKLKGLLTYKDKKHSKCILVDKHLARTHTGVEDIFPIHSDHKHTCVMETTNELGKHVMNFIADCLDITLTSEIRSPTGGATASAPDVNVIPSSSSPALSPSPPRMMDQMDSIATRMKKRQVRSLPELSTNIRRRLDPQLPLMSMESGIIIEDFVSRRDVLDRLDKTLSPPTLPSGSDTSVKLATLWGVGGIGKTSIAAEYMRTQESAYDALFWIRADGFQKILDSFERIAVMLKLVEADKIQDRHYARKLVMDWLEDPVRTFDPIQKDRLPRARWLLVFDNVDDFSLLKNFLPRHGAGSIIITSRDEDVIPSSDAPANKYAKGTVQVDPFPEHQAVEFLCRIAPKAQSNSHPQAELTVAQRLNCIPLALRQMGHYIDRNRLTFAEFLKVYENEATHEKLYRTSFEVEGSDYPYNISTVWRLQSLSPPTRSLLNVLSLLDPDHIQEEILVAKISNVPDSTYPLGNAEYFEARRELWSSSLISVQKDDGELSLHRIIQDAVRSKMDQEEFLDAFNMAASLLLEVWPIKGRMWHFPVDHWPKCGDLLGHVEKLRNCFNVKENPHFRNGPSPDPGFPQLLAYGGWFSHERGDSQEAKYFFDIAEKLCNSTKPLDEELLRDLWMCQGCVATETNDGPSCVRYYEKLLQKRQELTPKPTSITENEDLAIAYNEMGIGRMMMGNYEDAIDLLEVAKKYSDVRRVHTETTTSVYLLASANLGLAHWIEGHWDDALNILMKAHNVYQKQAFLNDKESFAPGRVMHAIGNVKVSQGLEGSEKDLDRGFDWHHKALQHYLETIGEGHHRTADVAHRLAGDYMRTEQYDEAEKFIHRALTVFDSKGYYFPEKMRTTHLHGLLCKAEGRNEKAKEYIDEACRMYSRLRIERRQEVPNRKITEEDFDNSVTFWSR